MQFDIGKIIEFDGNVGKILSSSKEDIAIVLDNIEELFLNQEAKYSKEIISSINLGIVATGI